MNHCLWCSDGEANAAKRTYDIRENYILFREAYQLFDLPLWQVQHGNLILVTCDYITGIGEIVLWRIWTGQSNNACFGKVSFVAGGMELSAVRMCFFY